MVENASLQYQSAKSSIGLPSPRLLGCDDRLAAGLLSNTYCRLHCIGLSLVERFRRGDYTSGSLSLYHTVDASKPKKASQLERLIRTHLPPTASTLCCCNRS